MDDNVVLSLFICAILFLTLAIYVNHTERLALQLKDDVRKSVVDAGHDFHGQVERLLEERLVLQLKDDMRKLLVDKQDRKEEVSEEKPKDCTDIHVRQGSGVYTIYPKGTGRINVYCDLDTDNIRGGWTVFQRRESGEEDFDRGWIDYENGFGNIRTEFWLGNSKLNAITSQGRYELMVNIEDFQSNKAFARYDFFEIGDLFSYYQLYIGGYSGTAGNSLQESNNEPFKTKDKHNSEFDDKNCEKYKEGPWWFEKSCSGVNLNGEYLKEKTGDYGGIYWYTWQTSYRVTLKKTTMMIRRIIQY